MKTWGKLVDMMNVSLTKEPLPFIEEDDVRYIALNALEERFHYVLRRLMGKNPVEFELYMDNIEAGGHPITLIAFLPEDMDRYSKYALHYEATVEFGFILCAYVKEGKQRVNFVSYEAQNQLQNKSIVESIKESAKCADRMLREEMVPLAKYLRDMVDQLGEETVQKILYAGTTLQQKVLRDTNMSLQKIYREAYHRGKAAAGSSMGKLIECRLVEQGMVYRKKTLDAIINLEGPITDILSDKVSMPSSELAKQACSEFPYRPMPKVADAEEIQAFFRRVASADPENAIHIEAVLSNLASRLLEMLCSANTPRPIADAYVAIFLRDMPDLKPLTVVGTEEILSALFPDDWQRFYCPEQSKHKKGCWGNMDAAMERFLTAANVLDSEFLTVGFCATIVGTGLNFDHTNNTYLMRPYSLLCHLGLSKDLKNNDIDAINFCNPLAPIPTGKKQKHSVSRQEAPPAQEPRCSIPNWMRPMVEN